VVAKANPLKQGLKQGADDISNPLDQVAKANPLKQGLKRARHGGDRKHCRRRKGQSTKTRIETFLRYA